MRFSVSGRVQGVSFRYYTVREAARLGVSGWVRNLPDGRVEIFAQGFAGEVDRLFEWAHQGPRFASVKDVEIIEEGFSVPADEGTGEEVDATFEIRY